MAEILGSSSNNRIRIFLRFLFLCAFFQLLVFGVNQDPATKLLIESFFAKASTLVINTYDQNWLLVDNQIKNTTTLGTLIVNEQCTGLTFIASMLAICFSVFTYRPKGLLVALVIVALVIFFNVLRISHLYYLYVSDKVLFDIFHLYVWQFFQLSLAVGMGLCFLKYSKEA